MYYIIVFENLEDMDPAFGVLQVFQVVVSQERAADRL